MTRHHITLLTCLALALITTPIATTAQDINARSMNPQKLSTHLRHLLRESTSATADAGKAPRKVAASKSRTVCAFVQTRSEADTTIIVSHGGRVLASFGDICIASLPIDMVPSLSLESNVRRIEAQSGTSPLLDITAQKTGVDKAHNAVQLPQAFDGSGVVMGVQDVGFDLTHPTFRNSDGSHLRIQRFWDQLSTDPSDLPVGADYRDEAALLAKMESRDAYIISHGTHTTGIAAGNGYLSPYRGIAPGSDICLVSNAVNDDRPLISDDDIDKYTYATDALGFKYIFDYAESVGKPCVINFSEGATQDFRGDDVLYYETLSRLTGPGRILVVAAGNTGHIRTHFNKPKGVASAGAFIRDAGKKVVFTVKSDAPTQLRLTFYGKQRVAHTIALADAFTTPDPIMTQTFDCNGHSYSVEVNAYKSCYDNGDDVFDVTITCDDGMSAQPMSVETLGTDANTDLYRVRGDIYNSSANASLNAGDNAYGVLSPSSAPSVICVGATTYRTQYTNEAGELRTSDNGSNGSLAHYSSRGPTFDGRKKPDVVAPGTNVISSYGSTFIATAANNLAHSRISTFSFNGRTYAWQSDTGTSLAAPVVAGTIALWLQADPTLSPDDVRDIMSKTCSRHEALTSSCAPDDYGYGEIDAYRGLLHILGVDGIDGVSMSQPKGMTFGVAQDGTIGISLAKTATQPFTIDIYNTTGQRLIRATFPSGADHYNMAAGNLAHGIYVVQASSSDREQNGSSLIRR